PHHGREGGPLVQWLTHGLELGRGSSGGGPPDAPAGGTPRGGGPAGPGVPLPKRSTPAYRATAAAGRSHLAHAGAWLTQPGSGWGGPRAALRDEIASSRGAAVGSA